MTVKKKLTCQDVEDLINLETLDSRPDRASMSRHLRTCESCGQHAPELAWLYGHLDLEVARSIKGRQRNLMKVAGAALVLLAATASFFAAQSQNTSLVVPVENVTTSLPMVAPTRVLPKHFSTVQVNSTNILPEQAISSTTEIGVASVGAKRRSRSRKMEWIR